MLRKPIIFGHVASAKALGVSAVEAELAEAKAPTEFRIFRGGENSSTKGVFLFDDDAADSVMGYFQARGLTLKMDYEHQSLNAAKNGQPAPNSAYAWTPQVRRGADGLPELWAVDVKWTDRARQMIEAREYSYFSPAFLTDDDNRVIAVLNVALTNLPALDGIDELIAASVAALAAPAKERPMKGMKCTKCSKALRAPSDDNDGDEVACTVCLSNASAARALTTVSLAMGLKADAGEVVVAGAVQGLAAERAEIIRLTGADSLQAALGVIQAWKQAHGEVTALRAEVETTKQTARNKEFGELLDRAVTEQKISAAFRADYWEKIHAPEGKATEAGLVQLRAFVGANPPTLTKTPVRQPQTGGGVIPKTQLDMASNMGLTGDRLKRFEEDRKARMAAGE